MSATVVTPDSAISAPLSSVPTYAISRVRYGSIGPVTWTNHSQSVCVSPIPVTRPSEKCPWRADEAGGEDAGAVADHLGVREVAAQPLVRPDRGDPLAGDRDRAVAQVPVGPGGEHVPGPDEKGARGDPRAPLLHRHYFADVLSPMAGLMYSLV